jgi:thioredoxin 1
MESAPELASTASTRYISIWRRNPLVPNRKRADLPAPAAAAGLLLLLALATGSPTFAGAAAARVPVWTENLSMQVAVDGKSDGQAHLYDSEDFQRMLLVLDDMKTAMVLDLGSTTISSVPPDAIRETEDGTVTVDESASSFLTGLERTDGVIRCEFEEHPISISALPPLVGPTTLAHLLEMKPAYSISAQAYKPDPRRIAELKGAPDTEIRIYFGTWCFMCKRLVPPLIRSLEAAANPKIKVQYIGVDEDLREPAAEIARDHVTKTPTIVVLQGGREIGRIEEKAETTIEADLASIMTRK